MATWNRERVNEILQAFDLSLNRFYEIQDTEEIKQIIKKAYWTKMQQVHPDVSPKDKRISNAEAKAVNHYKSELLKLLTKKPEIFLRAVEEEKKREERLKTWKSNKGKEYGPGEGYLEEWNEAFQQEAEEKRKRKAEEEQNDYIETLNKQNKREKIKREETEKKDFHNKNKNVLRTKYELHAKQRARAGRKNGITKLRNKLFPKKEKQSDDRENR